MRLLAVIILAAAGLTGAFWLGGHSGGLPSPLRDFARDDDLAVVDAAIERVYDDYFRAIPREELSNDAIRGVVRGLDDRFSGYFDPKEY